MENKVVPMFNSTFKILDCGPMEMYNCNCLVS